MEEYQIWTLWSSNRIGSALMFIGTVLLLWLALRVAAATRASDESNLFTKIVSSGFGILAIGAAWNAWSIGATNWVITAANLDALEEKSQTAIGFIEYVGTTVPSGNPATGAMILLGVVAIMILYQIWAPKK